MEIIETEFLSEYYRYLIEISDINKSPPQRENLINSLMQMVANEIGLVGVNIKISIKNQTQHAIIKEFIVGIDARTSEQYLKNLTEINSSQYYQVFDAQLYSVKATKSERIPSPSQKVNQVLSVKHVGLYEVVINLFSRNSFKIESVILGLLKDGTKAISQVYSTMMSIENLQTNKIMESMIFDKNIVPMFLLDNKYNVKRINIEAQSIFSKINNMRTANLLRILIDDRIFGEIDETLQSLDLNGILRLTRQDIGQFNLNPEFNMKADLIFKRIEIANTLFFLLNVEVLNESEADRLKQDLQVSEVSLVKELENYAKLYRSNREEAIVYGMENFFPATFAFTINEHSGPLLLSTSPELDPDIVFEGMIKLVAALNTNQIINLGYVVGSSPWSTPSGDLRWIAFYIENPKARGDVEIHVLGMVAKDNLLMMKSEITNPLLGVLLGSMNQYSELIQEDKADFVTEPFDFDNYFSTVSLITQILQEIRASSSELLAAYSLA